MGIVMSPSSGFCQSSKKGKRRYWGHPDGMSAGEGKEIKVEGTYVV